MLRSLLTGRVIFFTLTWLSFFMPTTDTLAGDYLNSAHGSSTTGVFRPIIGNTPPAGFGYSRGNCAHCHEQHASIGGSAPQPATGGAAAYELFAPNFNTARTSNPYDEADNFCFYCHNDPASAQPVLNNDYSQNFGCGPQGTTTIKATMDQVSYHNLYDIWNFSKDQFAWFTTKSNPCNACHNPHLARNNWANAGDSAYSAISKPTDHFVLWGTTETMDSSYNTRYQPPFCSDNQTNREPAASIDAATGRAATPDYVAFCTSCHNNTGVDNIDWSSSGDKHGERLMDGSVSTKPPYDTPSSGTNLVLSCLDCHDPHGSGNVELLRRRVNGSNLSSPITSLGANESGFLCAKCHMDDEAAGTGAANSWEYVHHDVVDAPYVQFRCITCHPGRGNPIPCEDCHSHGSIVSKADKDGVYRRGF